MSKKTYNSGLDKWRERAFKAWFFIGACVLVALALYICGILQQAVATCCVTALVVFLLHGAVNALERHHIPRALGTAITFIIVTALLVGCVLIFVPATVEQLNSFVYNIPYYSAQLQNFANSLNDQVGALSQNETINSLLTQATNWVRTSAGSIISSFAGGLLSSVVGMGNVFIVAFMSLLASFWVLIDLPRISREVRSLFSDERQEDIDIISSAFGKAVYGWAKSTLICAVITGVASGICFYICGIPYSVILGALCGLLYLIPYIGPAIACVIVAAVALFVSPLTFILSIVINVIINNVVGSVLSPRLMKNSVNVHPAIILIVIMIGGALGGAIGMLAAIPIAAAIQGVFITYFEKRTGRTLATEDGALFQKQVEKSIPHIDISKMPFNNQDGTTQTHAADDSSSTEECAGASEKDSSETK